MRNKSRTLFACVLLAHLWACGSALTAQSTETQTTPKSAGNGSGGKASTEDAPALPSARTPALAFFSEVCPISTAPSSYEFAFLVPLAVAAGSAAINALLPPLINAATGSVADHLQRRADELNASSTAFANGTLYTRPLDNATGKLSPFTDRFGCLVFVRGGLAATGTPQPAGNWVATYFDNVNDALKKSNIPLTLVSPPEIYAEFNIHYQRLPVNVSRDRRQTSGATSFLYQAIGFAPVWVAYEKTGAIRPGNGTKQLIFSLAMSSNSVESSSPSGTDILSQTFDLGDVKTGTLKKSPDLIYKTPRFAKIPQPSTVAVKSGDGKTITGYVDDNVPITVQISLTETENAGDVERAVASSLRNNESQISSAVTQAVINLLPKQNNAGK